ncbi:hypothetical protein QA635_35400 [Bradyrhizobium brasilense]|uniref:hypothetical protein n=1 Tax=Bradyrhizobium brasilense TaxID=1419277 RepID=UPI0024B1F2E3|nr:hypothetical protein [Bradyrhizobium australafricanum]WFU31728.1 hypothetical protein QA635_35400 [Bradyrhizobium australafricanum]
MSHLSRHSLHGISIFAVSELLIRYVESRKNGYRHQQSFHAESSIKKGGFEATHTLCKLACLKQAMRQMTDWNPPMLDGVESVSFWSALQ